VTEEKCFNQNWWNKTNEQNGDYKSIYNGVLTCNKWSYGAI